MENRTALEIIVATFDHTECRCSNPQSKRFATWSTTVASEFFGTRESEVERTRRFLESSGHSVDIELLRDYAAPARPVISLRRIAKIAKCFKPLEQAPMSSGWLSTKRQLQESHSFDGILTFSTPVISSNGEEAFLEVLFEEPSYMGTWYMFLIKKQERWQIRWKCMSRIS